MRGSGVVEITVRDETGVKLDTFKANLNAAYSLSFDSDSIASYCLEQDITYMEKNGFDPFDIPLYTELYNDACRRKIIGEAK